MRKRYLCSILGRWISRDPLIYMESNSLYEYVFGEEDPSGAGNSSITIWVDESQSPNSFNLSSVKAEIQTAATTSGIIPQIKLIPTTASAAKLNLGFRYDRIS